MPGQPEPRGCHAAHLANQALREAADRLVTEWHQLPPGSVLRCFSMAVRTALLTGHSLEELAAVAEREARSVLTSREHGEGEYRRATPVPKDIRVPRPRRVA